MTKALPKEIWDKDFHVAPAGFVLPEKIIRERGEPIRPEIEASEVGRKEAQMTQKTKPRAAFPIFASFVPFGGQPPGAGRQPWVARVRRPVTAAEWSSRCGLSFASFKDFAA